MHNHTVSHITQRIGTLGVIALVYWVFVSMLITVLDLKIFRQRTTETFFFSIFGIIAILAGALMLNIMANLAQIAEATTAQASGQQALLSVARPFSAQRALWFLLAFPLLAALLWAGHHYSEHQREKYLQRAAEKLVAENPAAIQELAQYRFDWAYLNRSADLLDIMQRTERDFPRIQLLQADTLEGKPVLLTIDSDSAQPPLTAQEKANATPVRAPQKIRYLYASTPQERQYLFEVLRGTHARLRFEQKGSNFKLYYPVRVGQKHLLLLLSDHAHYGKMGS